MEKIKNRLKYGTLFASPNSEVNWEFGYSRTPEVKNTNWVVPDMAPLSEGERGIILAPPVSYDGLGFSSHGFNLQDLRMSLLFFDKIGYATNNIIHIAPPREIDWLCSAGLAEVVTCQGEGYFDSRCIIEAQKALQRKLDQKFPGAWGIGRGEGREMFSDSEVDANRGLRMRLFSAIPVPDKDVPLQDVLEFKKRRGDELVALRHHIERLYQSITAEPDQVLAERTEFEALRNAIRDHLRVASESGPRIRLSDLSMNFTIKDAAVGLSAGLAAFQKADLNIAQSFGVGATAALTTACLSIGVGASISGRKPQKSPFEYVSRYHKELFIR